MELEPESCDTLLRLIAVCSTANPHLALAAADAVVAGADRGGKKQAALRQAQSATAAFASGFTDRLRDQTWLDGMGANEALASKNGARSTASSTLNGGGENTPRGRSSGRSPRQSRSTSPGPTPAPSHRAMAELRSAAAALDDDDDAQWHPLRSQQHHQHHQHHQHGAGSERSGSAGADSSQPRLGQDATWSEHTDPASGVAYYHNNATGASSWHRPPHLSASLRQHTSGGSAGLRTAASAPTLGSCWPSASDASAASTASIARPLTAQPATGLGSGGGGLGGGGGARKRPTSAATLFFQRRDHEKVAHSRHALPAASRAGRPHAGTMGSGGRPSKGDDLLIYYELLNDSAVAATDAMFRPGALAVKATAEATSASLCRPQTAPAYNKPGPAAAMSPQRSPDGGSRRGGGASPASDAGGGMQPTSATGGALGGNRRPTAAQRRAATEAMLKQQVPPAPRPTPHLRTSAPPPLRPCGRPARVCVRAPHAPPASPHRSAQSRLGGLAAAAAAAAAALRHARAHPSPPPPPLATPRRSPRTPPARARALTPPRTRTPFLSLSGVSPARPR